MFKQEFRNGHKLLVDTTGTQFEKSIGYVINNTGCPILYISIWKDRLSVPNDSVPYDCGE